MGSSGSLWRATRQPRGGAWRQLGLRFAPWLILALASIAVGSMGQPFLLSVATTTLLWIILAGALNLVMGYGGLPNLGIGAFYGVGAYAAGLVNTRWHDGIVVALVVAVAACVVLGGLVAPLVLRTRGLHFAIATLAFGLVAADVFTNLVGLTGGPVGLAGIERPAGLSDPRDMYWLVACCAAVMIVLYGLYHRSRLALVLRGIRDDAQLTTSLGYQLTWYKVSAFTLSCAGAGFAGALYAYFIQYLSPDQFSLAGASFQAFAIVAFGGSGAVWGPAVGAVLLTGVPALVQMHPQVKLALYGVALLLVVLAVPEGVVPGAQRLARRIAGRSRHGGGQDGGGRAISRGGDPDLAPAAPLAGRQA